MNRNFHGLTHINLKKVYTTGSLFLRFYRTVNQNQPPILVSGHGFLWRQVAFHPPWPQADAPPVQGTDPAGGWGKDP